MKCLVGSAVPRLPKRSRRPKGVAPGDLAPFAVEPILSQNGLTMSRLKTNSPQAARALATVLAQCVVVLFWLMGAARAAPFNIVTSNYPPFCYEEKGEQKGIAVEIVREAFARMKTEVSITFFPFPRAVNMLKSNQVDAIFPFAAKEDRASYTAFPSEKLVEDTQTLFVRVDSPIAFDGDLKKLRSYTFGRQRDASNGPLFTEAMHNGTIDHIDDAADQKQNILKLVHGRFDIAIGPRLVVLYYAKESGNISNIKELHPAVDKPLAAYLGFSKQRDLHAVMALFDETLKKMRQDGSTQAIVNRYTQ